MDPFFGYLCLREGPESAASRSASFRGHLVAPDDGRPMRIRCLRECAHCCRRSVSEIRASRLRCTARPIAFGIAADGVFGSGRKTHKIHTARRRVAAADGEPVHRAQPVACAGNRHRPARAAGVDDGLVGTPVALASDGLRTPESTVEINHRAQSDTLVILAPGDPDFPARAAERVDRPCIVASAPHPSHHLCPPRPRDTDHRGFTSGGDGLDCPRRYPSPCWIRGPRHNSHNALQTLSPGSGRRERKRMPISDSQLTSSGPSEISLGPRHSVVVRTDSVHALLRGFAPGPYTDAVRAMQTMLFPHSGREVRAGDSAAALSVVPRWCC